MNSDRGDDGTLSEKPQTRAILADGGESEEGDDESGEAPDSEQDESSEEPNDRDESEESEEEDESDEEMESGENGTHELAITVENEDGSYVQSATVTAEDMEGGRLEGPEEQETGSDGEVTFRLEDGDYIVEADADGDRAEEQVAVDGADEERTLTLVTDEAVDEPEEYELTVAVESSDGDPLPQADLTVESNDMGIVEGLLDDPERQGTDSSGEATFALEDATYTVEAEIEGEQLERTVDIDGADEDVTLTVDVEDSEEDADEEEGRRGPKEAEGEVSDDESASHGTDRGTTVLYLDLEGLFLDLLGLEVDLHEVVLDIRAIPGGGKLLGNLLSAVAGLLSGGPLSAILNRLLNSVSKLLGWLTSPLSSLRSLASRAWDVITKPLDWLRNAAGNLGNTLGAPIDWLGGAARRVWNVVTSPLSALRRLASGIWSVLTSPIHALRSAAGRVWEILTAPVRWLRDREGTEEDDGSDEEGESGEGQSTGVGNRISSAMPDADRLTQATTSVLDELSGGPDAEEVAEGEEADESSPSTAGQQLGEILGRRLGEMITGALGNDSDGDEPSGS
ncbi:hypothetical protein [Halococcus sp. AFM35]|uniref:hypothetical protein n=1 Tax=Halococcus sp. AFM35 TaxID=3421653 RepID=UPI003EBA7C46